MYRSTSISSVLALLAVGLLVGCGSSDKGQERTKKAVGGLKATQEEIAAAHKQVDENLAALGQLESAPPDLAKAFEKYKKEIDETEAQAKRARERAADMRARAEEYQKKWQEEMSQVTDPELRAAASARAAKVRERYSEIQAKGDAVRGAYEPFITSLKEVRTYLSNDLTSAAVTAAKPVFDKTKAAGAELNKKLDALAAELDAVATEMSAKAKA